MAGTVVVLGGGAAGFFGALRAKSLAPEARVILLEATRQPLQKVRISGGGRCNVTNAQHDPALLVQHYPRGAKELRSVLAKCGPRDVMSWFETRGVPLKTEAGGRVFPASDDSESICACLMQEAARLGVDVRTGATVTSANEALHLTLKDGSSIDAEALLVATGSNPAGVALAASLGHRIVPPVPSLFSFNVADDRLAGLAGVSVPEVRARLTVAGKKFEQVGALLVTHWGLSAHAVLRLSAWAARELHDADYHARVAIDFVPDQAEDALRTAAAALRTERPAGSVAAHPVTAAVPRRLWERLVAAAGLDPATRWAEVPNRDINRIVEQLKRATFDVTGKGPFKEEFVTAGGVARKDVDWRTMASRRVPGLHFAGEVLDVDALTGGYNLQNAWATGWVAGTAIGEALVGL